MAVELRQGMRRYTCLVPVVVMIDGKSLEYRHVHLRPVTRKIERRWQDGEIQGPYGALEALIDELTAEPYCVIEEMQHPDVELFNREFLAHIPRSIADMLARGEYPAPAPPPFTNDPGGGDPDMWPDTAPDPQAAPSAAETRQRQAYVDPQKNADPEPSPAPDLNFQLAEAGPDESLGTPQQQEQASAAFEARRAPGDGLDLARELVEEPAAPALKAAVERAASEAARPGHNPQADWKATPRDPFDPNPQPPKASTIKPPTRASAEKPGVPPASSAAPPAGQDPRTGREAIFQAPPDYVPDMSVAGYEVPAPRQPPNNAFGIGDMQ